MRRQKNDGLRGFRFSAAFGGHGARDWPILTDPQSVAFLRRASICLGFCGRAGTLKFPVDGISPPVSQCFAFLRAKRRAAAGGRRKSALP